MGGNGETAESDSMGQSIPAGEELEVSDSAGTIELERLSTTASVGISANDIQINRGMVLDSSQWPHSSHFYESSEEELMPPDDSPLSAHQPDPSGVSSAQGVLTRGSAGVLTRGSAGGENSLEAPQHVRTTDSLVFT